MNEVLVIGIVLAWLTIFAGGWLGWQLLRQNGRLLLRLEDLEKRLDSLEFGELAPPAGLPIGSPAPEFDLPDLAGRIRTRTEFRGQSVLLIFFNPACGFCREMTPKLAALPAGSSRREENLNSNQEQHGANEQKSDRGLEQQKRHGAAALHDLAEGVGRNASRQRRGVRQSYAALIPVRWQAQIENGGPESKIDQSLVTSAATNGVNSGSELVVLIVSTGDAEANRQLFEEHKVTHPVLLQKEKEVAAAYQANGTPSGYLIDVEGKIASGLAIGADALLEIAKEPRSSRGDEAQTSSAQSSSSNGHGEDQSLVTSAATTRFKNHSLARSKIKRDGLKAGTPAPDFRLPRLDGRGELALSDLRGRRVLLVFSSPNCGPCNTLATELEKFHRANRRLGADSLSSSGGEGKGEEAGSVQVVMITKGEPKENRAKVKEHGLTFPIVLQQQWEISRRYAMFATPIAYLIDEHGIILHDVAAGTDAIQKLLNNYSPLAEKLLITND